MSHIKEYYLNNLSIEEFLDDYRFECRNDFNPEIHKARVAPSPNDTEAVTRYQSPFNQGKEVVG